MISIEYKTAVEKIVKRRKNDLIQAQMFYDSLLNNDKELFNIETAIRSATLDYAKTGNATKLNEMTQKKYKHLADNGISLEQIQPQPHCKKCYDTGYCDHKICDCVKKLAIEKDNQNIKLPLYDFDKLDYNLYNDKDKPMMRKITHDLEIFCEKYPNTNRNTICLVGNAGTGKTFLTGCICKKLIDKNASVIFITAFELIKLCLEYHTSFDNTNSDFDKLLDCDFLAIDDLGTESIYKNITLEYLFQIINERQMNNKFTLITSNLNAEQIAIRYGDRIESRLFDINQSYFKSFNFDDLRKKRR